MDDFYEEKGKIFGKKKKNSVEWMKRRNSCMDLCRMLEESDMDFQVKGNVRRKGKEEETRKETKEKKKRERVK